MQNKNDSTSVWTIGPSAFEALPEEGARLMRWDVSLATGKRAVLYWPDVLEEKSFGLQRGGNPLLFPFAARCYVDGQEGYWKDPAGVRRPMPIHGWLRTGRCETVESTPTGFKSRFIPSESAQASYPFRYELLVVYTFRELGLTVDLVLTNQEEKQPIPWCAGHHFYFNVPWHAGLSRQHYCIQLPAKKAFHREPTGALRLQKEWTSPVSLEDLDLVDRMHAQFKEPWVRLGPKGGEEWIELRFSAPSSQWLTCTTWTASQTAPFYCVEPWMGPANAPEHRKGLCWVEPGATQVFSVSVDLV